MTFRMSFIMLYCDLLSFIMSFKTANYDLFAVHKPFPLHDQTLSQNNFAKNRMAQDNNQLIIDRDFGSIYMSHFAYACKMRYPLNLVLESWEYLWFY